MRRYRTFVWKEASLRISCPRFEAVVEEVKRQRAQLEAYLARQPEFLTALVPIILLPEAPPIARRMHAASLKTGVGPMAAVAGAIAQMAVEAALRDGAEEAIVENGGDLFLVSSQPVTVGLYAGSIPLSGRMAFVVEPARMPLSICASSSRFGHSLSYGDCELAAVVAADGALADAAATLACNSVKTPQDIQATLERVAAIPGISGLLIIKDGKVGLAGELPRLVRAEDSRFGEKAAHLYLGQPV